MRPPSEFPLARGPRAFGRAALVVVIACLAFSGLTTCGRTAEPGSLTAAGKAELIGRVQKLALDGRRSRDAGPFQEAERLLSEALTKSPRDASLYIALGELYLDRASVCVLCDREDGGDSIKALARETFEKALALDPENVRALYGLARDSEGDDRLEPAIETGLRIIALDPDFGEAYLTVGICHFKAKRYDEAKRYLLEAQRRLGESDDELSRRKTLEFLGLIAMVEGDRDRAQELLDASIEGLDGFNERSAVYYGCPYQALGLLQYAAGNATGAAANLVKAAEIESFEQELQLEASLACFDVADFDCALRFVDRGLDVERRSDFLVLKSFLLILEQRWQDAERAIDEALFLAPEDRRVDLARGHLEIVNRHYDRALELLGPWCVEEPPRAVPDPARPYTAKYERLVYELACLGSGWAEADRDRHDLAVPDFDRVLQIRPDSPFAQLGKANSLMALGRIDAAEAILDRVLKRYPKNAFALSEMALVRLNRGDYARAEQGFREALENDSNAFTCPHEGLGLLYLRQGRLDEAKKHLTTSIEIAPDVEYRKYNALARIYIQEGRTAEAEALLRKSIANFPDDPEAARLLESLQKAEEP